MSKAVHITVVEKDVVVSGFKEPLDINVSVFDLGSSDLIPTSLDPRPHVERLQVELLELDIRTESLSKFLGGDKFKNIGEFQQNLLKKQYELMVELRKVLSLRLEELTA